MSVFWKFECVLPWKDDLILSDGRGGPIGLSRCTQPNDSELVKRLWKLAPQNLPTPTSTQPTTRSIVTLQELEIPIGFWHSLKKGSSLSTT